MAIVKSLLIVVLLLVISQGVPLEDYEAVDNKIVEDFEENQFRLPKHVVPIHYDVKLIPHIVENNFTTNGETNIDIEVRKPTNVIALHVVDLTIDESLTKITRKGVDDENSTSEYVPKQHEYNELTQILTLRFEEPLDSATYTLHFNFVGVILSNTDSLHGFYRSFYTDNEGNKVWMAVTHFQPTSARQAFPCWDEPAIKATFKFSIKHYPNYTALSNMPSTRSEVDAADGKLWTHFEATPIMSTNLLGFVIADYDYVSNLDGTVKIWGPKHLLSHAAYPLDIAEKATQELEKFTNSTVRVPKMDHVSIPHYSSRATENWGMIVYAQHVLEDNSLHMISKLIDVMTITHELAHQWFGNLVSPVWWKYLWLSEGISTYLKFYITDKFLKEKRLMDYMVVENEQVLNVDSFPSAKPVHINITSHRDVSDAYSYRTYFKSAFLLRMASHFLREDVFRNGLIKYLQAHEYSSATPDDLWKALQDALDESDVPHDDFKVKEVMDTWFEQARYPLVTVNRDYATGQIKITQEIHEDYAKKGNEAWWIPLNFATQSNLDFSSTLATHWLKPHDEGVIIEGVDTNDWIIVNKHLTGYYRVNYDITNWKRIAAFLNSDNYDKIPVLNRAQIIIDAYYMMMHNRLDLVNFIEIINYLSRETDPAPWSKVFYIIEIYQDYIHLPEGAAILKPYLFNLMHKLFEHIDFEANLDDDSLTSLVRKNLYTFGCKFGHSKCQAKITTKLLAYVEDPIANKPTLTEQSMYCSGLMKANESIWDQFLQAQQRTSKSHTEFLGCSENLHIIEKHLNSLSGDIENNYIILFSNMLENLMNVDTAIEFFINNYEKFTDYDVLRVIIMKSFREDQIDKIKTFAEQHTIDIERYLNSREEMLVSLKDVLSQIRSAIESSQSTGTLNNDTS